MPPALNPAPARPARACPVHAQRGLGGGEPAGVPEYAAEQEDRAGLAEGLVEVAALR